MVRKKFFWMVLVSALILAGCIPVPIPIDLGDPEIKEKFGLPASQNWSFVKADIDGSDIDQKIKDQGISGTVTFHDIRLSGKVTVEGSIELMGAFIGFSLENPQDKSFEELPKDWKIDISGQEGYDFSVSAKDSPALKEALKKINGKEKFALYVVFGYESCKGSGTLEIEVTNVTVWVTWTAW